MQRECLKCGHHNTSATGDELEACPACDAIYTRVEAAMAAKRGNTAAARPVFQEAVIIEEPRGKRTDEKYCSECAAIINAKAEICPKCGVRQMAPPTTSASPLGHTSVSGKNKLVAGLLALFLGGIGVHKFYLGKGLQGILYLVFCWTFIPAVIGFVEGLNYLLMSEKTFFQRYGS